MKTYKLRDTFKEDGFYVTQVYGNNPAYYSKFNLLYHEGLDIGHKNKKHAVRALHDGVVIRDEDTAAGGRAYGKLVVLEDRDQKIATYYSHLSKNIVVHNQRVKAGDVIGYMGSTGNSSGPHVHLNFVQTDGKGTRLNKSKKRNWGYLDPQYPRDPGTAKFPGGVSRYKVEWYTGDHETKPPTDDMNEQQKKDHESMKNLRRYKGTWYESQDIIRDYEKIDDERKDRGKEITTLKNKLGGLEGAIGKAQNERNEALEKEASAKEALSRVKDQLLISEQAQQALSVQAKKLQEMNDKQGREIGTLKGQIVGLENKVKDLEKGGVTGMSSVELLRLALQKFIGLR